MFPPRSEAYRVQFVCISWFAEPLFATTCHTERGSTRVSGTTMCSFGFLISISSKAVISFLFLALYSLICWTQYSLLHRARISWSERDYDAPNWVHKCLSCPPANEPPFCINSTLGLVDRSTQLICIWILICQQTVTGKYDFSSSSSSVFWIYPNWLFVCCCCVISTILWCEYQGPRLFHFIFLTIFS